MIDPALLMGGGALLTGISAMSGVFLVREHTNVAMICTVLAIIGLVIEITGGFLLSATPHPIINQTESVVCYWVNNSTTSILI